MSITKANWIERARAEAQRLWAYADLISDHPEAVDHAHISGEAPETFAKELGEELELTSISEWNFGF